MFVKYYETDLSWLDSVYHITEWAKDIAELSILANSASIDVN